MTHAIEWIDRGREAQCAPDPAFPDGKDVDVSNGAVQTCKIALPYPAPRCGLWAVACDVCGLRVALTAAGRPDDGRSVRLPCGLKLGATGQFPQGKLGEGDEGELRLAVGRSDGGDVIIDFGKEVAWIGLPPAQAVSFAEAILKRARSQ